MRQRLAPRRALAAAATSLVLVLLPGSPVRAEESPGLLFQQLDLSVDVPTGVVLSLSYTPTFRLLDDHLRLGLGARFTSWLGGSGVVFKSVPDGAQYTLAVDPDGIYSLNLMFVASYRIVSGLEVGLNIDLIGAGFGGGATGVYSGSGAFAGPQTAKPAGFDLFLFGSADKGQLNSEFFAAWWFGEVGVRAGLSHIITEYVTTQPLDGGNTRFRSAINRFFASVGYRF
jgi:hypothetical protein